MNSCSFIGRVGQTPKPVGQSGARLSIAVDQWNGQTKERETLWVNLLAFGKNAETISKYVDTGRQIAVECHYTQREWTTQNGEKRTDHSFIIDRLHLLAEGQQKQRSSGPSQQEPEERLW